MSRVFTDLLTLVFIEKRDNTVKTMAHTHYPDVIEQYNKKTLLYKIVNGGVEMNFTDSNWLEQLERQETLLRGFNLTRKDEEIQDINNIMRIIKNKHFVKAAITVLHGVDASKSAVSSASSVFVSHRKSKGGNSVKNKKSKSKKRSTRRSLTNKN